VFDCGVVCLLAVYCGPNSPLARAMGNHSLTPRYYSQPVPIIYHFRGCKAPLSSIVSDAVLTLPFCLLHNGFRKSAVMATIMSSTIFHLFVPAANFKPRYRNVSLHTTS